MHWEWVATNSQRILELTLSHLYQGVVPVAIGVLVAMPVAYYASRRRDRGSERRIGARTLMHLSSLLYTIPSIALFVLMPLILGTSIISPLNVLVALSIYSFSLMVRSGVDAFDSVPDSVHESARALGYTPRQALMELYRPSLWRESAWQPWQILRWCPWVPSSVCPRSARYSPTGSRAISLRKSWLA